MQMICLWVIEHFPAIDFNKVKLSTTMNLLTIKSLCPGQIVTVTAKVTHLHPSKTVGSKNLQLQHAIIADPSGTMKMTLWENFVRAPSMITVYIRVR